MLALQTFTGWVRQQAAAVQAAVVGLFDFTVGSVELALAEANASVALWVQWLALRILALTRAASSQGTDLDSWMADFSLTRLAAIYATGLVTFSRFTTGQAALIPVGAQCKSADGTQTFIVQVDVTNSAWSGSQSGYAVAASATGVSVPVIALNPGTQANVVAGAISQVAGVAIPYIDTVTNAAAFTNGVDAESDAALRIRFANYINTRSRGTNLAVQYAISSVQQGLTFSVAENQNVNGSFNPGCFIVTVDDGSGAPSSTLLSQVYAAVAAVSPLTSIFTVQPPTVIPATVSFTFTVAAGYVKINLVGPVETAVSAFITALPMGAPLPYSRIAQVVYDVSPGITNVTAVVVNSATGDIGGAPGQVVRPATIVAS